MHGNVTKKLVALHKSGEHFNENKIVSGNLGISLLASGPKECPQSLLGEGCNIPVWLITSTKYPGTYMS